MMADLASEAAREPARAGAKAVIPVRYVCERRILTVNAPSHSVAIIPVPTSSSRVETRRHMPPAILYGTETFLTETKKVELKGRTGQA